MCDIPFSDGNQHSPIQLVYASDSGFQYQTYVSIYSVLNRRQEDYFLDIIILVPNNTLQLFEIPKWNFNNYSIRLLEIDDDIFNGIGGRIEHITNPTFYRLLIPELEEINDKCIYLDGDTICCSDIIDLFNIDIGDYCIAGCRQIRPLPDKSEVLKRTKELNIPSISDYINAGVLLLNVKKIREIHPDMINESLNNYPLQDQDVINKCFYNKCKIIHPRYNLYSWAKNLIANDIPTGYPMNQIKEASDNPCIIHFADKYTKPWINSKCIIRDIWWDVAYSALSNSQISKMKELLEKNEEEDLRLEHNIKDADKIYVFGAGKDGVRFLEYAKSQEIANRIICYYDNNTSRIGEYIENIPIYSPNQIVQIDTKEYIVIASSKYYKDIKNELTKKNIDEKKILKYVYRKLSYYLSFENARIKTESL